LKDELWLSYALGGAKDNPEMESFNGHFKADGHSLFLGAQTLFELTAVVGQRMRYYNVERRHSSISQVPPLRFIQSTWSQGEA
jgi:transposase InsO family protein